MHYILCTKAVRIASVKAAPARSVTLASYEQSESRSVQSAVTKTSIGRG
jgi:ribosome recycling factor